MDDELNSMVVRDFANRSIFFTLADILPDCEPGTTSESVCTCLRNGFLKVHDSQDNVDTFLSEKATFEWFVGLSMRLIRAQIVCLSQHQLLCLLSSLRVDGRWERIPEEVMAFGSRYAFVTEGNDEYVFPLVGLLSKAQSHTIRKTRELLHSMARDSRYREMFENNLDFSINAGLSCFQEQTATVIRKREGLDGRAETLEEIARQLGLTRERVRQIESKFWTRQKYLKDDSVFEPFLHGFLSEFIKNNGRRVIERTHPMRFLAKCLEVPEARVLKTSLLLLGSDKEFLRLDPDDLESFVKEIRWLCEKDLDVLASAYEPIFREKRKKSQKVFMALESIGRPAHFSEVAKKYVELFPDDIMSENSVHAILNRQGGTIVWVGAKGIYALSKWGYERPEKSLFDTVADIVKSIYEATGRPVTFNAIMAEIGKHRKVVVPSSIPMALAFNDRIKRLSKDQYSPASETKEDKAGFDERLDQALREFMDQSD